MTQTDTAAEGNDGMVCSADGVVVRIRSREARGEVPAYEYVVGSERDEQAAVQIRQPVPEDLPTADIGFPSACEDHWRLDGADLVAELVVEPEQHVQTIWGVRSDSHPSIEPPTVEVEPLDDGDADAEATDDGLDLETPPDAEIPADEEVPTLAGSDEAGDADVAVPEGVGDDASDTAERVDPADGDSTVGRLVEELESGEVDEETRAALADALEYQASDSANAFVEHVKDKLQRRTEQLQDEVESLEDSVEQLYGVKADASEIATIKRGLDDLDDRAITADELSSVRERIESVETDAAEDRDAVREAVEEASADAADDRAALREEIESLSDTAAEAERVAELTDELESLRDRVGDLESEIETIESRFESEFETVESRHEDLADDLDDLADEAATSDEVERLRDDHRAQINAAKSDVSGLRDALESEYTAADEISAEIDARLHRSVATLVLFGIGATGLLSTLPLAITGTGGAVVTFLVGAVALALWAHLLKSDGENALVERLAALRDAR